MKLNKKTRRKQKFNASHQGKNRQIEIRNDRQEDVKKDETGHHFKREINGRYLMHANKRRAKG